MRSACLKFLLWLCLALPPLSVLAQQPAPAGRVDETQGDVRIYDPAKNMRTAKVGDIVHEGDSVVTGSDGEVHLVMEDEGQIAVRPNTRLRIAKYKAEGGSDDTSVIALVQGALRSVTGWIGKYNPKGYAIRTPTATIGVRGTDHETTVIAQGSSDGEAGTYDKVNHGATLLSTPHGQTEVRPNQAGFVSLLGKTRPRLLASMPAFYRPARLDKRFENLHERVHQQLDSRRAQRIEAIRERRQKFDGAAGAQRRGEAQHAPRAGRHEGAGQHAQAQRTEQAEKRRLEQRQQFDERRKRLEEHRPGEAQREQARDRRERQERKRQSAAPDHPGGNAGEGRRGDGGGHPGARNH